MLEASGEARSRSPKRSDVSNVTVDSTKPSHGSSSTQGPDGTPSSVGEQDAGTELPNIVRILGYFKSLTAQLMFTVQEDSGANATSNNPLNNSHRSDFLAAESNNVTALLYMSCLTSNIDF